MFTRQFATLVSLSLTFSASAFPTWTSYLFQERATDTCVVDTTSGPLRPKVDQAYPDVYQYLGVPFAAPPTGDLRFAPPQPVKKSSSVINATQIPPGCYQVPAAPNIFDIYEPGFGFDGKQSEDCLKLDLYSPIRKSSKALPVVIFVYGGGFKQGGDNVTYEMPAPWVQAKQDLIVVNIQYRVNIFGFPNSAALNRNNLGLEDIRASVEWVRDNVAAFGGDSQRMILWGQSAGSIAVDASNFVHIDDPIVKGTISTSGVVLAGNEGWQSVDYSHSNFTFVAGKLGCSGGQIQLLTCMRKKSPTSIINVVKQYNATLDFQPIADNELVFANYTQRVLDGQVVNQPAVFGVNRREGERSIDKGFDPNGPNQTEALLYTDYVFLCPAQLEAKLRHQIGRATYRYEYKGNFSNISPLPWMGAYHASPLPLIFGTSNIQSAHPLSGASTPFELAVGSHMQDLWRAFAYDPTSLKSYDWPLNEGGKVGEPTDAVKLFPGANHTLSSVEYGAARERSCLFFDQYLTSGTVPSSVSPDIPGGLQQG